jgi:two-component system KDP operon response regulator KdpE
MNSAKILIVDDEPQIRRVLRATLSAAGYLVSDARDGEAALLALRNGRPDLVLLDYNLPGPSGLEICRLMREMSDVAIVMLTVRNAERDKIDALDAGADDYITKPFSTPELLARVRASLRRSGGGSPGESGLVAFDGIEINFETRQVSVRGKAVRLTPKEFDLLQYLVANPNVAIPHHKLLQSVWGPDYGNEAQYLHVFINQIRKKLEPQPSKPRYIVTEPWVGYRFVLPANRE